MKKSVITLFSALLVSSAVAVSINSNKAEAADQGKKGQETTAFLNIESGNLEIDHADNINFGTIMLDGKARDGKTNNLSTVKPADSANPQIKINDFRGSNDIGWQLSVKINSDKNSFKDTGMDISFFPSTESNNVDTYNISAVKENNMSPIASVSKSNIALKDTALTSLINLKPELSIPAYARANSYSAELVWNLSTLPQQ